MKPWISVWRPRTTTALLGALALIASAPANRLAAAADQLPAPQTFRQEVAQRWPQPKTLAPGGLRLVDVSAAGVVHVSDGQGWFLVKGGRLEPVAPPDDLSPGEGWIVANGARRAIPFPLAQVRQILHTPETIWLATGQGLRRLNPGQETSRELPRENIRQLAFAPDGTLLAATDSGFWVRPVAGPWTRTPVMDATGRDWAAGGARAVTVDTTGAWWVATTAGAARRRPDAQTWETFTGNEGLPWADFTAAAAGPAGEVWFATHRGAVRFDGHDWAYREGPAWLPGNDVRALQVAHDGKVWFATDAGLGRIERRPMTLAEKAAFYEDETERYIKRTPLGYVAESLLGAPGDRSQITHLDSDNDGLWTAMYGAGECFAYAATKEPEFKRRARQAFEALRFLQKVTQGGPHSPPKGFVARTILPTSGRDPNVGRLEADRRSQQQHDRLWKVYEPRWPRSADGKWYWKSDTSSDELDGHFFFYAAYYDLVAESPAERARVREVVGDLANHLLTHDFCLVDHDGRPTRWAVFGPRYLNDDPNWWVERGLNSLSILSYLAVADHITGDPRYAAAVRDLVEQHHYGANVMNFKTQMGVGSGNQSDDEMTFMCFYNLLQYARDSVWKEKWRFAFAAAWALEQPEMNPFFNFAFAALSRGQTVSNAFETIPVDPWAGWFDDAMATLRGFPLDRVNWPRHNSHRLDLRRLRRQQSRDLASAEQETRGYRVTGKVLPVAERHFNHWNTDPWQLDYGGNGRLLGSGTVFLLPYYLGLYHGFIEKP